MRVFEHIEKPWVERQNGNGKVIDVRKAIVERLDTICYPFVESVVPLTDKLLNIKCQPSFDR